MFDQNNPPPLMVEALAKRYPKGVWLTMEPDEKHCRVFEYCDEYRSVGYVIDGIYHIIEWSIVTPQSKDRARLDEALYLLYVVQNRLGSALDSIWIYDPKLGHILVDDAIDTVLDGGVR